MIFLRSTVRQSVRLARLTAVRHRGLLRTARPAGAPWFPLAERQRGGTLCCAIAATAGTMIPLSRGAVRPSVVASVLDLGLANQNETDMDGCATRSSASAAIPAGHAGSAAAGLLAGLHFAARLLCSVPFFLGCFVVPSNKPWPLNFVHPNPMIQIDSYHSLKLVWYVTYHRKFSQLKRKI
jgi:hypothetical protein